MTSTFEEAAAYSDARRSTLAQWRGSFARQSFGWVVPPVLNPFTRIAVEMCPARGILRVIGYESAGKDIPAHPVTVVCETSAAELAA